MTLYAITTRFRPGIEDRRKSLATDFGDHMRQPLMHIRLVGALKGEAGERDGVLMLIETESRAQLDHFLEQSPYKQADLYQSLDIHELDIEAGSLN
jgi:uncharacterized protein YciI